MNPNWNKYQGTVIWQGSPYGEEPTIEQARQALKESGAMLARWATDFDCKNQTEWWYCLCDEYKTLQQLTRKQRYRITQGLKNCTITPIPQNEIENYADDIVRIAKESFADYPKQYRPKIEKKSFISNITKKQNITLFLCTLKETQQIIGFAYGRQTGDIVYLEQVKIPTVYLPSNANAALAYTICGYFLKEKKAKAVVDGQRNIRHQTNYQKFLVQFIGFRFAYCKLNLLYSLKMSIAIHLLYPIRNFIKTIGKISPLFYNIYCILYQEQLHRQMQKT